MFSFWLIHFINNHEVKDNRDNHECVKESGAGIQTRPATGAGSQQSVVRTLIAVGRADILNCIEYETSS